MSSHFALCCRTQSLFFTTLLDHESSTSCCCCSHLQVSSVERSSTTFDGHSCAQTYSRWSCPLAVSELLAGIFTMGSSTKATRAGLVFRSDTRCLFSRKLHTSSQFHLEHMPYCNVSNASMLWCPGRLRTNNDLCYVGIGGKLCSRLFFLAHFEPKRWHA